MNSLSEKKDNRVVLITGSAGRIGAQTARRLHEAGMNIAIHYRDSEQKAAALKAELEASRADSAEIFQCDLNITADLKGLIDEVQTRFGRLDALVNNASSFYPTPVELMSEEQWLDLVGSNMKAPLFLSQAALELLKQSHGCIINLVDVHGFRPMKNHTMYSMAKAAHAMMVKSLARELAPEIRVNGVAPGAIEWPDSDSQSGSSTEEQEKILARIPLKRKGEFDDIAKAIRFLIIDAPYITGEIIQVDGGRSVQQ